MPYANAATKLMGLIGQGIGYSFSPLIHNFSAAKLGKNVAYLNIDISPRHIEGFLASAWDMGAHGFNVTKPYKSLIASLINRNGGAGAVNTLYRGTSWWEAASTDAEDLHAAISRLGVEFRGFQRFVFLGNGGVVMAVCEYVAKYFDRPPAMIILRRDSSRDEQFTRLLPALRPQYMEFDPNTFADVIAGASGETLILQASSAPQNGDVLEAYAPAMQRFSGVFMDLVYGQPSSLFQAARNRGIPCQDGLPMLIEQARLAQKIWWGDCATYEDIEAALRAAKLQPHDESSDLH